MSWYARVQSTNDAVEDLLLATHGFVLVLASEAILFVDELPNGWAIIIGICLDIGVNIEIFALVILLIFHMPNPLVASESLVGPFLDTSSPRWDFISVGPDRRDILLIASADTARRWFT